MSTYRSNNENEYIFSERIKAGKRTYFFDVKQTQGGDYYLVITESRKDQQGGGYSYDQDNKPSYKKSKIFLYKEELNNFANALEKTTSYIKEKLLPDYDFEQSSSRSNEER